MKKILSLCINLVIFIISDAFAVKLIAGNRSVVKKDGMTHTISKYYVVPNDFDPNNVTYSNTTEASQITKLRMNHSSYSKSFGPGINNEDHVSGVKSANKQTKENNIAVNKIEVHVRTDQNDVQDKVSNGTGGKIAKTTETVTTEHRTKPDALINLLVEPIAYHINISSNATADLYKTGNALQNESRRIVHIDDELDHLILTKFGLEVNKSSTKNIESFWKLVKLNMDSKSGNEELMPKLDRLIPLLNIFTNLYEAAKSQKPYESMIDEIIDIVQIPFAEERNTFESQSEISEIDYVKECLRKCGRNRSKAQMDSKGAEPEGQKSSNNSDLENLILQRRLTGYSDNEYALINPYDDRTSNEVIDSTEPTNSQLLEPYKFNVGEPDGYNVRSSKPRPELNHVARANVNIQRDPKSKQTFADSTETDYLDDQPSTTEPGVTEPWIIEDKSTESGVTHDQPLTTASRVTKPWIIADKSITIRVTKPWNSEDKLTESGVTDEQPSTTESRVTKQWVIEDKPTVTRGTKPWIFEDKSSESRAPDDQPRTTESRVTKPWIIDDKSPKNLPSTIKTLRTDEDIPWDDEDTTIKNLPWHIEYKTTENLPLHIVNKSINRLPWTIKHRTTTLPWIIEDRKRLPWIVEDRKQPPWIIEDRKQPPWIIEDRKQPPWIIEDRKQLPWIIEDRKQPPLIIEDRKQPPWIIEDRKQLPWIIEDRKQPPLIIEDRKQPPWIIEDRKQLPWIIKDRNHPGIVHRINNVGKKPYHIYTYVINPSTSEHEIPNSGKLVDVKSRQPNFNHITKSYSIYTSHGGNKDGYTDSPSYYVSSDILPKTTIHSKPSNSQLKHTKYVSTTYDPRTIVNPSTDFNENLHVDYEPKYLVGPGIETNNKPTVLQPNNHPDTSQLKLVTPTYDTGNDVNPSDLFSDTRQDDYQHKFAVGHGIGTNDKPDLLQPSEPHTNSDEDNDEPQVPQEESLQPVVPNIPFNPFQTMIITDKFGPISTASASVDTSSENPDFVNTEPMSKKPNINLIQPANVYPASSSKASSYSEYTLPNDYDEPIYVGQTTKQPGLISTASSSSVYTNSPDEYVKPNYIGPQNQRPVVISSSAYTPQSPSYISKASSQSEFILPNNYNNPRADSSENTNPEYTNVPDNYDEQIPVNIEHTDPLDHGRPVYGADLQQNPGYISQATTHSKNTIVLNDYNSSTADNSDDINQHPEFIPMVPYDPNYKYIAENYEKPDPINGEDINNQPGSVPKGPQYPEYTDVLDDYDKPTPSYSTNMPQRPGYISKNSTHSEYTNEPNNYNYPTAGSSEDINNEPGSVPKGPQYPEYTNVLDDYDKPTPSYSANMPQRPAYISKASAHSAYIYKPNNYIDDGKDTDRPTLTQNVPQYPVTDSPNYKVDPTLYNNGPTENKDIFPLAYNPHGQYTTQSSVIENLLVNEPTKVNHIEQFKQTMAPTYRLFTLDNLLKLHDAVIKAIEISGADLSDYEALINLRKIIKIILILAEQLEKPEGSNEWYMKIFYNAQTHRHPLQLYVYNLLRQKWLHELMLLLDNNNFDIQILKNPTIFSFLGSWQFPDYVQNFLKAEDLIHHDFDAPVDYAATLYSQKHKFSTHAYDDLLDVPQDFASYVTNKVLHSYKAPNNGIVLSIAGVEAEPDANAIINILQKYLHYKSVIENQENVIIHDNKVEMLKQIILFLKQKGYNGSTIADLIHKLYSAIYLSEGKDCQPHHPNFEKNIFEVILPVLRRSGR